MRLLARAWLLLVGFLCASTARADVKHFAVLEFGGKIDAAILEKLASLTRAGALTVLDRDRVLMMTRENMELVLKEMGKDLAQCEGECEVETLQLISADYGITGQVLKVRKIFVVTLNLYDVRRRALLDSTDVKGTDELVLFDDVKKAAAELVGRNMPAELKKGAPVAKVDQRVPRPIQPAPPPPAPVDERALPPKELSWVDFARSGGSSQAQWERESKLLLLPQLIEVSMGEEQAHVALEYALLVEEDAVVARLGNHPSHRKKAERALDAFDFVVREFPDFEKRDEALLGRGRVLWEAGMRRDSAESLKLVVKQHPGSEWAPVAWAGFGDLYAGEGDFQTALNAYRKAADTPGLVGAYASARMSGCSYGLANFAESLRHGKLAITALDVSSTEEPGHAAVRAIAIESITDAVARVSTAQAAVNELKKIFGNEAPPMIDKLAARYEAYGDVVNAIATLRGLRQSVGEPAEKAKLQVRVVELTARLPEKGHVVKEARTLASDVKAVRAEGTDEADAAAQKVLSAIVTAWMEEVNKTRDKPSMVLLTELMSLHLELFPSGSTAAGMRYQRSNLCSIVSCVD